MDELDERIRSLIPSEEGSEIVDVILKNMSEAIVVRTKEWRGEDYIDIRIFALVTGKWTRKGLFLNPKLAERIRNALDEALKVVSVEEKE